MLKFIVRRIFWTIPVLLVVIFLTFMMMRQIGGNPFRQTERAVPEAVQRNLERKFHVDKPWYMQYLYYVKGVATLDFGPSLVLRGQTVNDIVKEHFPKSIELGFYAFLLRDHRRRAAGDDRGAEAQHVGRLRGDVLLERLPRDAELPRRDAADLLRRAQVGGVTDERLDDAGSTRSCPSIALGFAPMALFARLVRGTMLETLQQDYVRTARAKGLRYRRVVGLHVLRNSLIPVITAAGPLLGFIITGSFVIELIFNIPGIGQYYVTAVNARDYSVVMGLTVLLSVIIIFANLVVDILYGILDPRTRDART